MTRIDAERAIAAILKTRTNLDLSSREHAARRGMIGIRPKRHRRAAVPRLFRWRPESVKGSRSIRHLDIREQTAGQIRRRKLRAEAKLMRRGPARFAPADRTRPRPRPPVAVWPEPSAVRREPDPRWRRRAGRLPASARVLCHVLETERDCDRGLSWPGPTGPIGATATRIGNAPAGTGREDHRGRRWGRLAADGMDPAAVPAPSIRPRAHGHIRPIDPDFQPMDRARLVSGGTRSRADGTSCSRRRFDRYRRQVVGVGDRDRRCSKRLP